MNGRRGPASAPSIPVRIIQEMTALRFITPDGAEWRYSFEFSGYWVRFDRVRDGRWIRGSREPLRELTDESLSAALLELWQRRRSFDRKLADSAI